MFLGKSAPWVEPGIAGGGGEEASSGRRGRGGLIRCPSQTPSKRYPKCPSKIPRSIHPHSVQRARARHQTGQGADASGTSSLVAVRHFDAVRPSIDPNGAGATIGGINKVHNPTVDSPRRCRPHAGSPGRRRRPRPSGGGRCGCSSSLLLARWSFDKAARPGSSQVVVLENRY